MRFRCCKLISIVLINIFIQSECLRIKRTINLLDSTNPLLGSDNSDTQDDSEGDKSLLGGLLNRDDDSDDRDVNQDDSEESSDEISTESSEETNNGNENDGSQTSDSLIGPVKGLTNKLLTNTDTEVVVKNGEEFDYEYVESNPDEDDDSDTDNDNEYTINIVNGSETIPQNKKQTDDIQYAPNSFQSKDILDLDDIENIQLPDMDPIELPGILVNDLFNDELRDKLSHQLDLDLNILDQKPIKFRPSFDTMESFHNKINYEQSFIKKFKNGKVFKKVKVKRDKSNNENTNTNKRKANAPNLQGMNGKRLGVNKFGSKVGLNTDFTAQQTQDWVKDSEYNNNLKEIIGKNGKENNEQIDENQYKLKSGKHLNQEIFGEIDKKGSNSENVDQIFDNRNSQSESEQTFKSNYESEGDNGWALKSVTKSDPKLESDLESETYFKSGEDSGDANDSESEAKLQSYIEGEGAGELGSDIFGENADESHEIIGSELNFFEDIKSSDTDKRKIMVEDSKNINSSVMNSRNVFPKKLNKVKKSDSEGLQTAIDSQNTSISRINSMETLFAELDEIRGSDSRKVIKDYEELLRRQSVEDSKEMKNLRMKSQQELFNVLNEISKSNEELVYESVEDSEYIEKLRMESQQELFTALNEMKKFNTELLRESVEDSENMKNLRVKSQQELFNVLNEMKKSNEELLQESVEDSVEMKNSMIKSQQKLFAELGKIKNFNSGLRLTSFVDSRKMNSSGTKSIQDLFLQLDEMNEFDLKWFEGFQSNISSTMKSKNKSDTEFGKPKSYRHQTTIKPKDLDKIKDNSMNSLISRMQNNRTNEIQNHKNNNSNASVVITNRNQFTNSENKTKSGETTGISQSYQKYFVVRRKSDGKVVRIVPINQIVILRKK